MRIAKVAMRQISKIYRPFRSLALSMSAPSLAPVRLSSISLALVVLLGAPTALAQDHQDTQTPSAVQTHDMAAADAPPLTSAFVGSVTAADPRAEAAGMAILRQGGSASDAAIATMLALSVVEPQSSGIGGGGFYVRAAPDGTVETLDGRETAPAGASPEWFLNEDGTLPSFRDSVRSGLSVGVPGNIALAAAAHAKYGKLPWADLFAPAIALARDGFALTRRTAGYLERLPERAGHVQQGRDIYFGDEGQPRPAGSVIRNPAKAAALEAIAKTGPDAFYRGPLAKQIAASVAEKTAREQPMQLSDLAGYEAKFRAPVCAEYRRHTICGMGPPSSGGIAVGQILGQLERFNLAALGPRNPLTWHLFLESQRLAYADRGLYLADSDFVPVPIEGLLDPQYLAERSALIAPDKAMAEVQPGKPAGADQALAEGEEATEQGTSHFSIASADGTIISYTSTIEGPFGSGLMTSGFYLNNELTDFSRSPSREGVLVANRVEGGKRPRSSMAPTVVFDPQGQPVLAIGAAGGGTIPVQTARSIIGVIDFGLSAKEALRLPFIMGFRGRVMVEKGTWLEGASEAFAQLGHGEIIARSPPLKAGALKREGDIWEAARDPRIEEGLVIP